MFVSWDGIPAVRNGFLIGTTDFTYLHISLLNDYQKEFH